MPVYFEPRPSPHGDPEGMRAKAASLRAQADEVQAAAALLRQSMGSTDFSGPAAQRFRHAMAGWQQQTAGLSGQLHSLADCLSRAASELERERAEVAAYNRRMQELARRRASGSGT